MPLRAWLPCLLLSCSAQGEPQDRLKADVSFLASDEMKGRRAGSPEGEKAARWMAKQFEKIGLKKGTPDGYLQPFKIKQDGSDGFNALGLLAWNQGRHREALTFYDSAVASARRNDDLTGIARAANNIPNVLIDLGDFDAARAAFDTALAIARVLGNELYIANNLANLARLEILLGSPLRALPLLDEARSLYRSIDYRTGEANALGQLATAFSGMGDLQRAIAAADSGLAIARA